MTASSQSLVNLSTWFVDIQTVAVAGTAERVPSHPVLQGVGVTIRAIPTNTDNVFIGNSQTNAQGTDRVTLRPGDSVTLYIANSNLVWVDAVVATEGVEVFAEGPGAA